MMKSKSGGGSPEEMRAADHARHTSREATRLTTCENRGTMDRGVSPVRVRGLARDPEPVLTGRARPLVPCANDAAYFQAADPVSPDAGSPPVDAGTDPITASPPDAGVTPADARESPADSETGDRGADSRGTDDRATGADQQDVAASLVTFKITWDGYYGGDLSARVVVTGVVKPRRGRPQYVRLAETVVNDPGKEAGLSADRVGPAVLSVARYRSYRIRIEPVSPRYKTTVIDEEDVPTTLSEITQHKPLRINRTHPDNVSDSWRWRKIDSVQARRKTTVKLFGRPVTVHNYALPRVAVTNLIFESRPASEQKEITESIYRLGGDVERTKTEGGFSNHSIGVAFDINANLATRQNDHFFKRHRSLLTKVIEPIVRIDRRFASFNIFGATGLKQLEASEAFIERFPIYVAALLNRTQDVAELERCTREIAASARGSGRAVFYRSQRDRIVRDLFSKANKTSLRLLARSEKKNSDLKRRLELIEAHWKTLFTWVIGADVKDGFAKKTKRAVGMIPLHPRLLEIMLAAGWSWGGNWDKTKDYMHFEDRGVEKQLKLRAPSKSDTGTKPTPNA